MKGAGTEPPDSSVGRPAAPYSGRRFESRTMTPFAASLPLLSAPLSCLLTVNNKGHEKKKSRNMEE